MRKVFPWIFIILMFAGVALGGEAPPPEVAPEAPAEGSSLMAAVYEVVLLVVGVLGSILATILIFVAKKYGKKVGIEIDSEGEKFLRKSADAAIRQVEAWAGEKKRNNSKMPGGQDKLSKAVGIISAVIKTTGLKKVAEEKLAEIVEERLFAMKAKGQMGNPT